MGRDFPSKEQRNSRKRAEKAVMDELRKTAIRQDGGWFGALKSPVW